MKYLLDTHTLIWFMKGDSKLPVAVRELITNDYANCYVSIISFWELAIKISLGKIDLEIPFIEFEKWLEENNLKRVLPLNNLHILRLSQLPFHHRDPFDRTLICQALAEDLTLISKEELFDNYGIQRLW
jgi:PIN domain nuclease of toxin-antitoxin system